MQPGIVPLHSQLQRNFTESEISLWLIWFTLLPLPEHNFGNLQYMLIP